LTDAAATAPVEGAAPDQGSTDAAATAPVEGAAPDQGSTVA
jgi:hypothetical protein